MRGKGMVVDISQLPDPLLEMAENLHNEYVKEQEDAANKR